MSVLALGLLFGAVTLIVMFSGMPIAFSLGFVALTFMFFFMPASSLDTVGTFTRTVEDAARLASALADPGRRKKYRRKPRH